MALGNVLSSFGPLLWLVGLLTGLVIFAATFPYIWYQYNKRQVLKAFLVKRNEDNSGPDVIIIGGGVIGTALATSLARDGRRVTVIERSMTTPDTFTGEGLIPSGRKALEQLGLGGCIDGIGGKPYYTMFMESGDDMKVEVPLKDWGSDMVHGRFVDNLREAACKEHNCEFLEGTVSKLLEENGMIHGVQYRSKGDEHLKSLRAPLTVVANGHLSKFSSVNVISSPSIVGACIGIEVEGTMPEIVQFFGSQSASVLKYALTPKIIRYLIYTKDCALGDKREFLRGLGFYLPEKEKNIWNKAVDTSRIRQRKEYQLSPIMNFKPGVMCIGDALSMRHSAPAAGMSVGFNDVVLWRELLRKITSLDNHQGLRAAHNIFALQRKLRFSFNLDFYAFMLPKMIIPESDAASRMGIALTECLREGGRESHNAVNIFQGLKPQPHLILRLLCVIIFTAMKDAILEEYWWGLPRGLYKATNIIYRASILFLPFLYSEWRSLFVF